MGKLKYVWTDTGEEFKKISLEAPTYEETVSSIIIKNPNKASCVFHASGFTTTTITIAANSTGVLSKGDTAGTFTLSGYLEIESALYETSSSSSITFTREIDLTSLSDVILQANNGKFTSDYIGKTITIPINSVNYKFRLIGVNHDTLSSDTSKKANTTWQMVNLLSTKYNMNSSDTNSGGWGSSAMRSRMSTFLSQLPSELQSAIKSVNKLYCGTYNSSTLSTSSDKLFILSSIEMNGMSYSYAPKGNEGSTYSYWSTHTNASDRIKTLGDSGSASWYWLRSPSSDYSGYFCSVNSSGSWYGNGYASNSYGVSLAFCI